MLGAIVTEIWPSAFGRILAAALACLPVAAAAQTALSRADYSVLKQELDAVIDFETLPRRPEPGFRLDAPMREGRAWLSERLAGQAVTGAPHDRLMGHPTGPLQVAENNLGANLSIAFHRGFGSNALFPLGPAGFPATAGRGEGAVAILFDHGQRALGLRVHSDYPAPLGGAAPQGSVIITFYTRSGARIGRMRRRLDPGVTELGFRRAGGVADIAAITVTNDDPGGIALDDILYQTAPMAF